MTAIINWEFPDTRQRCAMTLENCALTYLPDRHAQDADCTVSLKRATLNRLVLRELALPEALAQGAVRIDGDGRKLAQQLGLLDEFSLASTSSSLCAPSERSRKRASKRAGERPGTRWVTTLSTAWPTCPAGGAALRIDSPSRAAPK
jgi:hypothetical protein